MNKEIIGFGIDVDFKDRSGAEIAKIITYLEKLKVDWVRVNLDVKRAKDPKYLMLRKLETEKDKVHITGVVEKEQIIAIKDKILSLVKSSEENGGVELDKLITELRDFSPGMINQEIQKLLEEGIVFEPRPGKIRYLG